LREYLRRQKVRGAAGGISELGRMRHAEGEEPGDLEGAQVDDAGRRGKGGRRPWSSTSTVGMASRLIMGSKAPG
jgi:hypothetical protein